MCATLSLIPQDYMNEGWMIIMADAPHNDRLPTFLDYFTDRWLQNHNIPIKTWNVAGLRHRTNNAVEGWNQKLNSRTGEKQPNIFKLVQTLKEDTYETAFKKKKSTSKLEDAEATSLKTEAGQDITWRFTMEEKQVEDLISQWPGQMIFSLDEAEDWTERVRHTIHKIDACATELMKPYKESVNKIVVGLYARLEDLDSDNIFQNNLFSKIKIKEVGDMILSGDILQGMHKELTDQITQDEDVWRDVINMLTQNLQETFKFLRESGALWGRHKARVRAIHEVVLAALEHRFIESDFGRQKLEARLNLALDQLRQESVEDKLDKELREVWGILDTIKSILWESLRTYSNKCGPELRKDAEQWINKRTLEVKNRLTLKLSLHAPRYERVRREIRDVRHAELKLHRDRMEGHKLAVEMYLDELRDNTRGLRATLKLRVSQIEDVLSETENQLDSEIKTNKIKENLNQMEEKYQHFGDGLKDILFEFREECCNKISWIRESNLNFMKAIKLFSEGGNYSSDEAEMFSEQLDELDEDLEEEASAILRRIEDIQDSSVKKVRVKVDKTKESLSVVMEELQFSDLVVGVISRVQAAIKRDTLTLKRQGKLLEARLAAAVADTPGEHMADTWPRVFTELERRQQYLLRAVEIYQDVNDGQSSGQPAFLQLSNEKRQREALQLKLARGTRRFPDYREALLGTLEPARDVESFLARVFVILWDALGEIQEAACDFYQSKSNRPVLKTELIHPEFDSFMEEILLKVKYYHAQCVDVWLEQVQEFFTTVVKLRTSANEHAQSNLRRFHEASLAALRESRANFLSEFQSKKREGLLRVGELEGRLRPHHGYQGNRHLLEELHKEVMDRSAQLGEDMEVFYNIFKGSQSEFTSLNFQNTGLEERRSAVAHSEPARDIVTCPVKEYEESSEQSSQSYKLDMRAEGGRLSAVLEQLFHPDMTDRLNSLVDTVYSSLRAATATAHEGGAITHRRSTVAPRHKRSVRAKSFRGVTLPVGHKTVNLPPQRSVECDTLYTTSIYPRLDELRQVSSRLTWAALPTSEHQAERSRTINIDDVISNCAEDYASLQEQFTQEACSHFESYKKELTKCTEDWDRNVRSVKKLYLVPYM
uniref:(California timema) hypothetical protein n=1 Tax=Timema californicum TaxID=61474 RepID=A0A7R9J2E5_TIMCA|nr:unnamed protein product [Timema californicum]